MKLTRRSAVFNWPAELQMDEDQSLRNIELLRILAEGCPRHIQPTVRGERRWETARSAWLFGRRVAN